MSGKRFVSVICEYNPFHFGHKFQMERLKQEFDGVVCIQSGDIVQRGSVAVASKYLRAEAAIRSGASLVLELPIPWCCSSARDFARAGVHIAENIGTEFLAFGTEDGLETVLKIDSAVSSPEFAKLTEKLREENKSRSYPVILSLAVSEMLGDEYGAAVSKPNNILALEYISAMKGKRIKPFSVLRDLSLSSSSAIRSLDDGGKMLSALPLESSEVFACELSKDFPRRGEKLDAFFIASLRRMKEEDIPHDVYSAPKDLIYRLLLESNHVCTVSELVSTCTDKIYTAARVRRAINSLVFGITAERVRAMPPYTTVLAADSVGREILKRAKKNPVLDIVTKPVRALERRAETREAFLFAKGIEDVISLCSPMPDPCDKGRSAVVLGNR